MQTGKWQSAPRQSSVDFGDAERQNRRRGLPRVSSFELTDAPPEIVQQSWICVFLLRCFYINVHCLF